MRIAETWKRQAIRAGLIAALACVLLWPAYAMLQEPLRLPFLAALLITAISGASIAAITLADLLTIRRSRHARPARAFDLALGLLLALPAGSAAFALLGR